jgi:hypothetical protein
LILAARASKLSLLGRRCCSRIVDTFSNLVLSPLKSSSPPRLLLDAIKARYSPAAGITCHIDLNLSRLVRLVTSLEASMEFSSFPKIANLEYSPSQSMLSYQDQFDKDYLNETYNTSPDQDCDTYPFIDQPFTSIEMSSGFPSGLPPKSQGVVNPTLPATGISATTNNANPQQVFNSPPFGQLEQYSYGFSFDPSSLQANEPNYFSPTNASSRTPSLCGDLPQQSYSPTFSAHANVQQHSYSPTLSPRAVKEESPCSPASLSEETTPKRPQRKRGRPRLDGSSTSSQTSTSAKGQRSARLPHNQVERKYREGLNSELERLRRTVPTLPQSDEGGMMGQPKPSKAMVLSSAIEYIRKIEKERDALKEENERLKQGQRAGNDMNTNIWTGGDSSLDDFLTEL